MSIGTTRSNDMFGKTKDNMPEGDRSSVATPTHQPAATYQSTTTHHVAPDSPEATSTISAGMSIVGKVVSDGTVKIFGRVEGELHASAIMIADGAQVEGDVVAEDLTVGGRVKGIIHANRVRLNGTAIVEGDIFHRSLSIEENARFEGSSKREEAVIDKPSRVQSRIQSQTTTNGGARKPNGTTENEHTTPPAV
jgi:cytoskeletal protein CcmA (bactofilin family)